MFDCVYKDKNGAFSAKGLEYAPFLYFPIASEKALSCTSPNLIGDHKIDNHHFLNPPVSRIDLLSPIAAKNVWIIKDGKLFSFTGASETELNARYPIKKRVEAGRLWHKVVADAKGLGLSCEMLSFVDVDAHIEVLDIKFVNNSKSSKAFAPAFIVPMYGRSAEGIRDHRHVTSLLNRVERLPNGIMLKPTMSFDERGHLENKHTYFCIANDEKGRGPSYILSALEDVIGAGSLLNPVGILSKPPKSVLLRQGKEVFAAFVFDEASLDPGQSVAYSVLCGINEGMPNAALLKKANRRYISMAYKRAEEYWNRAIENILFDFPDTRFAGWMKWVATQPALRRIYGCSFLPDFDYGKGGRGWRDLWQDRLTLILAEPHAHRDEISSNFAGVRIDGSNATIIGKGKGEFIADRNRISRVWMDHGLWPFFTLRLYIAQTADTSILFDKQPYFRDAQIFRAAAIDKSFDESKGTRLLTRSGKRYLGTILEHVLVQHLVQFFNVGRQGLIRLEGADWNDGLDMARKKGQSAAFTHFYAGNLEEIARLLDAVSAKKICIFEELKILLDAENNASRYSSVRYKRQTLKRYLEAVQGKGISGRTIDIDKNRLKNDLLAKACQLRKVLSKEWIDVDESSGFFNGYYDESEKRVDGIAGKRAQMCLTGQVFAIMCSTADDTQVKKIINAVNRHLRCPKTGGVRLNTDYGGLKMNLGRAFGFSYGDKENGAVFSHMAVMYANALIKRGFVREGWDVLLALYRMANNFSVSKIYPCLPEYFDIDGQGLYCYLTGSASWYIFTVFSEGFGIIADLDDFVFAPKVVRELFKGGRQISVCTKIANKRCRYIISNPSDADWPDYVIDYVKINKSKIACGKKEFSIKRQELVKKLDRADNRIEIVLARCAG